MGTITPFSRKLNSDDMVISGKGMANRPLEQLRCDPAAGGIGFSLRRNCHRAPATGFYIW
jgi:hypothetical protein